MHSARLLHPPFQQAANQGRCQFKPEQDKRRREEALANATGMRVLQTVAAAVPGRLMKRDILFIAEQVPSLLDESVLR
jgi:ParB family chromosome partitioning protein